MSALDSLCVLQSYGAQGFKVSDVLYPHSILLAPTLCVEWNVQDISTLTPEDFAPFLALDPRPEILLLGTGSTQHFLPPALKHWFLTQKIICETMNTGAACRTYSVLVAEDRKAAAALIFSGE